MELVLKVEHSGSHATFLDLDNIISNDKISTKLYDKRDDLSFMVYTCQTFIATFFSKILRIARSSFSKIFMRLLMF